MSGSLADAAWISELLSDTRAVVRSLLEEPLLTLDRLARQVHEYRDEIARTPTADQELGLALAQGSLALLDEANDAERHRLVQVAVRYFLLDDDGEDDLASPFGFDDDVEVFNAIAGALGRDDLVIGS